MGLENLKSAFSNIETFNQSDVTQISSENSIITEPQEVDYMGNEKVSGFTANLEHKSDSLFVGINVPENMTWTNTSLYGEGTTINEYPNLYDSLTKYRDGSNPDLTSDFPQVDSAPASGGPGGLFDSTNKLFTGEYSKNQYIISNYTHPGPVNFIGGTSLHPDSIIGSDYVISGFTKDYDPGFFGGWSEDTPYGDSKLLSMWATTIESPKDGPIKTSLYTGYIDKDNNTIEFPGPVSNFNIGVTEPGQELMNAIGQPGSSEFLSIGITNDESLTGDPVHPPGSTFSNASPGDITTLYSMWTRNESGGGNIEIDTTPMTTESDGTITFDGFHIGRIGKLQNGNLIEDIYQLGRGDLVFETLYNNNQTVTENKFGGNLLDNPDLFVTSNIVDPATIDSPSMFYPTNRILDDEKRIGSFLKSTAGIDFIATQNILGTFQMYKGVYDKNATLASILLPSEGLLTPFIPIPREGLIGLADSIIDLAGGTPVNPTYTEYLNSRVGIPAPPSGGKTYAEIDKIHRPLAYDIAESLDDLASAALNFVGDLISSTGTGTGPQGPADITIKHEKGGITPESGIDSINNMNNDMDSRTFPLGNVGKGDSYTLMEIQPWGTNIPPDTYSNPAGSGMPFYFRDLRDGGRLIFFRAYLEGISDTISPSWTPTNYIGRSEPVYTYTNSEREIQFTLKLFAQTKDELNMIYIKMNRLTSLCYPEYQLPTNYTPTDTDSESEPAEEIVVSNVGKTRMKPPLTKFRLGDLFGSSKKEMTGFIKSLSYTFPDESPWEIEAGNRVPKYISVDIGFQVIHSTVPSLDFARTKDASDNPTGVTEGETFYGITSHLYKPPPLV